MNHTPEYSREQYSQAIARSTRHTTPRQRAEQLLKLHGGNCFVPEGNSLGLSFLEMQLHGLVTIKQVATPAGMEIRSRTL